MRKRGLSFVELLIVLGIIVVLVAVVLPIALNVVKDGKATKVATNFKIFSQSMTDRIYLDGELPTNISELARDVDTGNYGIAWKEVDGKLEFVVFTSEDVDLSVLQKKLPDVSGTVPEGSYNFIDGGESSFEGMTACYVFTLDNPGNISSPTYGSYVFDEDFDLSTIGLGWPWTITDKGLMATTLSRTISLLPGEETWTDYTVNVVATFSRGEGYGIIVRATGSTYYIFSVEMVNNCFSAIRVRGNSEVWVARKSFRDIGGGWTFPRRPEKHYITITAKGDHFTMTFNGIEVLNFRDSHYPTGRVGIGKWFGSDVAFESITIQRN